MTTQTKIAIGVVCVLGAALLVSLIVAPDQTKEVGEKIKKTTGSWMDQLRHQLAKKKEDVEENSQTI